MKGMTSESAKPTRIHSKTSGFINGRGKAGNGLVNGMGRINGLINGKRRLTGIINGRGKINGMVNGRGKIDGFVNGQKVQGNLSGFGYIGNLKDFSGMINGRGRINGLINGRRVTGNLGRVNGRVNGIINGVTRGFGRVNGLVNGFRNKDMTVYEIVEVRGSRFYKTKYRRMKGWQTLTVTVIFLILMVIPFAATYTIHALERIQIDGSFSDWTGILHLVGSNYFKSTDTNKHIEIQEYACDYYKPMKKFSAFIKTEDKMLEGNGDYLDSINIFIDTDTNNATGYIIRGIGADTRLEITGINNSIQTSQGYCYGGNGRDWSWGNGNYRVKAALNLNMLELSANMYGEKFRWLIVSQDSNYNMAITKAHNAEGKELKPAQAIAVGTGKIKIDGKFNDWTGISGSNYEGNGNRIGILEERNYQENKTSSLYLRFQGNIFTGAMPEGLLKVEKNTNTTSNGTSNSVSLPIKPLNNTIEGNDTVIIMFGTKHRAIYKGVYEDIYVSELQEMINGTWITLAQIPSASAGQEFETSIFNLTYDGMKVFASDWKGKYDFIYLRSGKSNVETLGSGSDVSALVTVQTSTNALATAYSQQRKCLRDANNYYWACYYDDTNTVIERSDDTTGATWLQASTTIIAGSGLVSLWYDDATTVWASYYSAFCIRVKKGTLSGNPPSIAFGAASIALMGTGTADTYVRPYVSLDSSGYVWVASSYLGASNARSIKAVRSTNIGNNPAAWGSVTTLSGTANNARVAVDILPLATQDMYAIWRLGSVYEGEAYTGGAWSGVTDSIATSTATAERCFASLSDSSGKCHMVYVDNNGRLQYNQRTSSWQGAVQIDATTTCYYATITQNPTNGELGVFYVITTAVWYSVSERGVTWTAPVALASGLTTPTYTNVAYHTRGDVAFYIFTTGSASPWTVNGLFQTIAEAKDVIIGIMFMPLALMVVVGVRRLRKP